MITTRKQWELFEFKWSMMRQNPGGKSALLQGYLLGFAGTADITGALNPAEKRGRIKIKVGGGAVQMKDVSFKGFDVSALPVPDAAAALNAAGFERCRFSADKETGRLKLAPLDKKTLFIQIYGDLAAALNFGNCKGGEGKGCYIWASMDGDLKSVAETEEWEEDKKIENDSPMGKKVTYTIPGKRGGTKIVVTDRLASREAKQMINGGVWIAGDVDNPDTYEPPVDLGDDARRVDILTFSKVMDTYDTSAGAERFIRERLYVGGVGHMARSGGAGNWSESEYSVTCASYTGDDGREHASPKETDYTLAQWEALGLSGIIEVDWADGMGLPESIEDDEPEITEENETPEDETSNGGSDDEEPEEDELP